MVYLAYSLAFYGKVSDLHSAKCRFQPSVSSKFGSIHCFRAKVVKSGKYIFVVSYGAGFGQFGFRVVHFGGSLSLVFKRFPKSYAGQQRANIACRLTCCHVPFRGIFPLEKHSPFRQLVRVATRS